MLIHQLKKIILFLALFQLAVPAYASDISAYSLLKKGGSLQAGKGSEFVSGARSGVLMKVNIWGAVGKPGIHHVPAKTGLIDLLSYAGGPAARAELDSVLIKRDTGKSRKRIRIDVEEIINGSGIHQIPLEPNDIVVVPVDEPLIAPDTVALLGVVSIITTIVLTGFLIADRADDN